MKYIYSAKINFKRNENYRITNSQVSKSETFSASKVFIISVTCQGFSNFVFESLGRIKKNSNAQATFQANQIVTSGAGPRHQYILELLGNSVIQPRLRPTSNLS